MPKFNPDDREAVTQPVKITPALVGKMTVILHVGPEQHTALDEKIRNGAVMRLSEFLGEDPLVVPMSSAISVQFHRAVEMEIGLGFVQPPPESAEAQEIAEKFAAAARGEGETK